MKKSTRARSGNLGLGLVFAAAASLPALACQGLILGENAPSSGVGRGQPGDPGVSGPSGEPGNGAGGSGSSAAGRLSSPVSRLTNQEFVNSAKALLRLPQDVKLPDDAEKRLAAEPVVRGLTSDANGQQLTKGGLAGYSTFADSLTEAFLEGVASNEELAARLKCVDLGAAPGDLGACIRSFARALVPRAYRRDVTEQELTQVTGLVDRVDAIISELSKDPNELSSHLLRVKSVIRQLLLSPHFLLLVERGTGDAAAASPSVKKLSSFEIASRLAYFTTASLPDDELLEAARQEKLADPQSRLEQAQRLLNSETGRDQFAGTLQNWLDINPEVVTGDDMGTLTQQLRGWFSEEKPFSDFYQSMVTVKHVDGTESQQPLGVLGTRAFIASHSTFPTPGFITRGVFVVESLLCGTLPDDVPAGAIDGAGGTEREVFDGHARQPCASCHRVFDNYGAAFQQFDTESGLFNPSERKLGADLELFDLGGISGVVTELADLGRLFGASSRAPDCMAELWYRHALRRGFAGPEGDRATLDGVVSAWNATGNSSMKSLLSVIVQSDNFVNLVP